MHSLFLTNYARLPAGPGSSAPRSIKHYSVNLSMTPIRCSLYSLINNDSRCCSSYTVRSLLLDIENRLHAVCRMRLLYDLVGAASRTGI